MLTTSDLIYSVSDEDAKNNCNCDTEVIPFINYNEPAPKRCLNMLLAKYYHRPYQSEVIMNEPEKEIIPVLKKKLNDAKIMLFTDGGLVPKGNPDRIPSTSSKHYGIYSIEGMTRLDPKDYMVSHQGYDNTYILEDPNRLLPLDALRELERKHVIGSIHDCFVSTTGVMSPVEQCKNMGKRIAEYAVCQKVDAVIIVSACGTSTRCGSYIGKALREREIPIVQVTNLTRIAVDMGITRVVKGNNICYPFGNPELSKTSEYNDRMKLVQSALELLMENPE